MIETILQDLNEVFQGKAFLTVQDVMQLLDCSEDVVYNWTKRSNPKLRPPRVIAGKAIRFPKREFARWLAEEQGTVSRS